MEIGKTMTAIVAIIDKGKVYMGGDSAGVGGYHITTRKDPKVFINGDFIFGFTSSFRMGQLLQYSFNPPEQSRSLDDRTFIYTDFINSVRECFSSGGYMEVSSNRESGGNFLVGYKGTLYNIDDDFQIGIPYHPFDAVGCGFDLCLGSLYSTRKMNLKPEEKITMALEAAQEFSAGVRGPFVIEGL